MKINTTHKPIHFLHDVRASTALTEQMGDREFTREEAIKTIMEEGPTREHARIIVTRLTNNGFLEDEERWTRCLACSAECDIIEVDKGGKEEIWGRMEHVPCLIDVSACCEDEYEYMYGEKP